MLGLNTDHTDGAHVQYRIRRFSIPVILTLALTAASLLWVMTPGVRAEDGAVTGIPDPSIATSLPSSLADPLGIRKGLAAHGITYGANYIGEYFGVASGGLRRDAHYDGRFEMVLDADLERIIGWKGLAFHVNGYQIHGESVTAESLGSLAPASFIEAEPSTRLFELYLEQSLMDGLLTIRAGQLAADSEFIVSDGAGAFINGTWGWPTIAAGDLPGGGPAFPLAVPGVRIAVNPEVETGFMAAVFNGQIADDCPSGDVQRCNDHGLDFPIGDNALIMLEGFQKYTLAGTTLPGRVKIGGWIHTGDFAGIADPQRIVHQNHAIYGIWDQMLIRFDGDRNLSVFARVIVSPDDINEVDFYAEAGVTLTGLLARRPADLLGIGFAYTGISDDAQAADRNDGVAIIRDYEALIEISYTASIVPGFSIQPDLQYFWNPGGRVPDATGTRVVENALVIGLRSTMNY